MIKTTCVSSMNGTQVPVQLQEILKLEQKQVFRGILGPGGTAGL